MSMDFFSLNLPGPSMPTRAYAWPEADEESSSSDLDSAQIGAFGGRPRISDLPFPDPQRDDERIENALWLLENNPSGRALRIADEPDDEGTSYGPANLFGLIGSANAQARGGWGGTGRLPPSPMALARREFARLRRRKIRELEPNNLHGRHEPPRDHVPTIEELDLLDRELRAAEARASAAGVQGKPKRGGETDFTIGGRFAHREYEVETKALGDRAEVDVPGGRIDRLHLEGDPPRAEAGEYKSYRRENVEPAERQAKRYAQAYESAEGIPTSWWVEFYDLTQKLKRILSEK